MGKALFLLFYIYSSSYSSSIPFSGKYKPACSQNIPGMVQSAQNALPLKYKQMAFL